jgi:hypothetical protein
LNRTISEARGNVLGSVTNGVLSWTAVRRTGYGAVPRNAGETKMINQRDLSMKKFLTLTLAMAFSASLSHANLVVKVDEPKTTGSKAVIKLEMKNTFTETIESARAVIFLLDDQGKVVGQMTRWVIGGTKDKPALAADAKTTFNFVVPTDKPFTRTKVSFNRVVLEGGKSVDVSKSVEFQQ